MNTVITLLIRKKKKMNSNFLKKMAIMTAIIMVKILISMKMETIE